MAKLQCLDLGKIWNSLKQEGVMKCLTSVLFVLIYSISFVNDYEGGLQEAQKHTEVFSNTASNIAIKRLRNF
jgi:hypothetical protein